MSMVSIHEREEDRPKREGFRPNLRLLKWLAIVLPILFLVGGDILRRFLLSEEFPPLLEFLFTYAVISGAVIFFSYAVFGFIGKLQGRITGQNRQLTALNRIATVASEKLRLENLQADALVSSIVN